MHRIGPILRVLPYIAQLRRYSRDIRTRVWLVQLDTRRQIKYLFSAETVLVDSSGIVNLAT